MKDLKDLKGAKVLSKTDQKSIKGGLIIECDPDLVCIVFSVDGYCIRCGIPIQNPE